VAGKYKLQASAPDRALNTQDTDVTSANQSVNFVFSP
jgi:hypothetical protein